MIELLNSVPLAAYMLVVALGFAAGRVQWRGIALGPAGGTLGVAICFGLAGLSFHELYGDEQVLTVGLFGFVLFIYSVGFEAGPRFFTALRGGSGWRFVVVGTVVNVTALALAVVCGKLFGLNDSVTAGLLAGALTSAPTYAAATDVCSDTAQLAVSFALTYPLGLAGVVILIQFLPKWMGDSLEVDTEPELSEGLPPVRSPELTRAYDVQSDEVIGKSLKELDLTHRCGCYITQVHRGDELLPATADTCLERGDHVLVRGRFDELEVFRGVVGPEVYDDDLRRNMPRPRRVRVTEAGVRGKSLKDLQLATRFGCLVTTIERGRVALEPWPELGIERDDVLVVVGPHAGVRAAARALGRFEQSTNETNIAIYAAGIFLGLFLAKLPLGFDVTLGTAGGLLFAGVLLGRFRRIGPFSAHVPKAARQLVRDFGILLFVAETGVAAGESSFADMKGMLGLILVAAVIATVLPVWAAARVGRWLRLRPVNTWGSIGGGMTSSAALVALRRAADSDEPAISYAASYAVASVLVTIAGQVVVYMML